jgi:hypothetical protein
MYYATGLPGWARFGYPGWAAPAYPAGVVPLPLNPYGVPFPGAPYAGRDPKEAAKAAAEHEAALLRQQAEFLTEELEAVKERLEQLAGSEEDKTEEPK